MSRRTSQVGLRLPLFQIEILDFSRRKQGYKDYNDVLVKDNNGFLKKRVDTLPEVPCRTIVDHFKNYEAALRAGNRLGSVISCHKVNQEYYLKNIEQLNLKQAPLEIEIDREEFTLDESFEIRKEE